MYYISLYSFSNMLGDRIPYEGAKKHDQPSLKADTDILQNILAENYGVSR